MSAQDKTGLVPYMLNHHQQNNTKDDPVNTKGYKCKTLDKYKKKFDRDIRNNKGRDNGWTNKVYGRVIESDGKSFGRKVKNAAK